MNLTVRNGQLTLGSVFKLVAIAWLCFGFIVVGGFFLLIMLIGVASGSMTVNGEAVVGRGTVLLSMLPMLVILPLAIVMQAVMFGGMVMAGAALFRLRRPLTVSVESTAREPV